MAIASCVSCGVVEKLCADGAVVVGFGFKNAEDGPTVNTITKNFIKDLLAGSTIGDSARSASKDIETCLCFGKDKGLGAGSTLKDLIKLNAFGK